MRDVQGPWPSHPFSLRERERRMGARGVEEEE
jgi:acetylornithine deacetylase/succinyl-diaminopimelate desuccinylase-like protein